MEWLWGLILLAILVGPLFIVVARAALGRRSGLPKHEQSTEALGMIQTMKDQGNLRTGGRGW